jgi:hypothetical protein
MANKTEQNLVIALQQVNNLEKLAKTFEYSSYLETRLSSIKYELERQLKNCLHSLDKFS